MEVRKWCLMWKGRERDVRRDYDCHMPLLLAVIVFLYLPSTPLFSSALRPDLCICILTAGVVLLIVRLIIRSITLECVAGPCYDWSAFPLSLTLSFHLFWWTLALSSLLLSFSIWFLCPVLLLVLHHFSSIQFSSIYFNSIQFNSIQFSSVQFSSIQFNSVQLLVTDTLDNHLGLHQSKLWQINHSDYRMNYLLCYSSATYERQQEYFFIMAETNKIDW